MSIFRVEAGKHPFKPSVSTNIGYRMGRIGWRCALGASCIYEHGSADQQDYNKLCGVSFCLTSNHRDSAMIGWRWNPKSYRFELTPYWHNGGIRIIGENNNAKPVMIVEANEPFFVWLSIDWKANQVKTFLLRADAGPVVFTQQFHRLSRRTWFATTYFTREIGAWFGGNQPAPHTMYLEKTKLAAWEGPNPPTSS